MGMSTHIVGYQPADSEWDLMKSAYLACVAAKIEFPKEINKFFGGEDPTDMSGREVDISPRKCGAVTEYRTEYREGFEINLALLPENVRVIRVFNSY